MGGGILPVAFYKDKFYFLFSREYNNSDRRDRGLWSDFGGSSEPNESITDTAIREGWEESDGFLGTQKDIKKLIEKQTFYKINTKHYFNYIDRDIIFYFNMR